MRILIIEDDASIASLQRDYLEIAGFDVDMEEDGAEGLKRALAEDFDLVIVDIMLPGADGFTICREIRKEKECPVLVVSAKSNDIDKIRALGLGADDYMVKPFSPNELVARVQAHIARHQRLLQHAGPEPHSERHYGRISIQPAARKVAVEGQEIVLTNKEYELLDYFTQHLDVVLSKEDILRSVWGMDAVVETATVAVHVNRLREKIEPDPAHPVYIQTVWGIGYRFTVR